MGHGVKVTPDAIESASTYDNLEIVELLKQYWNQIKLKLLLK